MPKISELSAVTDTEATGDDYVPVVSGGTTKRMLLSELAEEIVALEGLSEPAGLTEHLEDEEAAHAASAVSADDAGFSILAGGDVQELFAATDTALQGIETDGGIAADIVDAAGDLIVGSAADTVTRLALGAANEVLAVNTGGTAHDYRDAYALPQTVDSAQIESFTVALDQVGQWVPLSADDADARVITLPQDSDVAVPVGSTVVFEQVDALAEWTFTAGAGASILAEEGRNDDPRVAGQGAVVFAFKKAADTWRVSGALALDLGEWTEDGADTAELVGGQFTLSRFVAEQNFTATEDPLPYADGGLLGTSFLARGDINLDYVGDAPVGPRQATGFFGPVGVFQNSTTQTVHENQKAYGHGPIGFQDTMLIKNVADENRDLCPSYTFIASRICAADGGTVALKRTDALDGMSSYSDNMVIITAGDATIDADQTNTYQINGSISAPIVHGNVSLWRRVGFYVNDITGGAGTGSIWDAVPGIGGRLTNTVDDTTATIEEQFGVLIPRLAEATTNVGIRCDSPIQLWQDTVTFAANQSPVIDVQGTWTIGTGADLIPVAYSTTTNVVVDNTLNVFAVVNSFNNDVIYKSATNATVRDLKSFRAFADTGTVTADTSADTMSGYTSFVASATLSRVNSGTLALSELTGVAVLPSAVGAGVTVTTARGLQVRNPTGSGTVTNLYGLDIETLSKGGTKNRPIRLGAGRGIEFATQDSAHDTTSTLSASGAAIYTKGNNLVVSYNDAGTMRFLYIALTGTGTTWTHDTSGP
jgi:hypothetical protein